MLSARRCEPTRGETAGKKKRRERPEMSANITMKMKLCSDDGSPSRWESSRVRTVMAATTADAEAVKKKMRDDGPTEFAGKKRGVNEAGQRDSTMMGIAV